MKLPFAPFYRLYSCLFPQSLAPQRIQPLPFCLLSEGIPPLPIFRLARGMLTR